MNITPKKFFLQEVLSGYSQDIIESDVLGHVCVLQHQLNIFRAVRADMIPKRQQGLFVVMCRYCRFRYLRVEEVPQLNEILPELKREFCNRFRYALRSLTINFSVLDMQQYVNSAK